jgi:hypothetical protein
VDYPTKEPSSEQPKRIEEVRKETEADIAIEKEALLYELDIMEKQGLIKLHRVLSMQNSLEEIQYQYDRANMIVSTQQTVEWAKSGIKMGSSILESVLKRFGVSVVEGFSNNLCKDMSKFNKPMTKMYRKYWRRGTSSPEMELAMIVFGALAMTILDDPSAGAVLGVLRYQPQVPTRGLFGRERIPAARGAIIGGADTGYFLSSSSLRKFLPIKDLLNDPEYVEIFGEDRKKGFQFIGSDIWLISSRTDSRNIYLHHDGYILATLELSDITICS